MSNGLRSMFLVAFLVIAFVNLAGAGEVRIVAIPSDGTVADSPRAAHPLGQEPAATAAKITDTSYKAWVPFFVVDTADQAGVNTLFAVRNRSASTISVRFKYLDTSFNYGSAVIVTESLDPHETKTVSIRDVPGIPVDPATGLKTGVVEIEEDTMSGQLSGDWFLVDAANNFASGDRLISFDSFCVFWDTRYFHGGPFDGGTTFNFWLGGNLTGGTSPIMVGQVYDPSGTHQGTVQIYTPEHIFEVNTAELPQHIIGSEGTIEWTIQDTVNGYVQTTFRALGKYSAGLPGMCVDSAVSPK